MNSCKSNLEPMLIKVGERRECCERERESKAPGGTGYAVLVMVVFLRCEPGEPLKDCVGWKLVRGVLLCCWKAESGRVAQRRWNMVWVRKYAQLPILFQEAGGKASESQQQRQRTARRLIFWSLSLFCFILFFLFYIDGLNRRFPPSSTQDERIANFNLQFHVRETNVSKYGITELAHVLTKNTTLH